MSIFNIFFSENKNKILLEKGELRNIKDIKEAIKAGGNMESKIKIAGEDVGLFHVAIMAESKSLLKLLLEKGGNINDNQNMSGKTPLHTAIILNEVRFAKLLIAEKANINIKDNEGKTPLHYAVQKGNYTVVYELLKNGAAINMQDALGRTPLHYSYQTGNPEIMVSLLTKDSSVLNIQDLNGQTALHHCISNPTCIALLLAFGADSKIADKSGNTPRDILDNITELGRQAVKMHNLFKKINAASEINKIKEVEEQTMQFKIIENLILSSKSLLDIYDMPEEQRESILGIEYNRPLVEELTLEEAGEL